MKNKHEKILRIIVVLVLSASFSGCGGGNKPQTKATVEKVEDTANPKGGKTTLDKGEDTAKPEGGKTPEQLAVEEAEKKRIADKTGTNPAQKELDAVTQIATEGEYVGQIEIFESATQSDKDGAALARFQSLTEKHRKLVQDYETLEQEKVRRGFDDNIQMKNQYVQELEEIAHQEVLLCSALEKLDIDFRTLPEELVGHEIVNAQLKKMDDRISKGRSDKEKMDVEIKELEERVNRRGYPSDRLHFLKFNSKELGQIIERVNQVKEMLTQGRLTTRVSADIVEAVESRIGEMKERVCQLNESFEVLDHASKDFLPILTCQAKLENQIEATYAEMESLGRLTVWSIKLLIVAKHPDEKLSASLTLIDSVNISKSYETKDVEYNVSTGEVKIMFSMDEAGKSLKLVGKQNLYDSVEWFGDVDVIGPESDTSAVQQGVFHIDKVKNYLQVERDIRDAESKNEPK